MQRERIRKTEHMKHVTFVESPPDPRRYVSLRHFMAACPASKKDKVAYRNAIHYLLEKKLLTVTAIQKKERARRYYDQEEIPLVRQALAIHREGIMLDKAFKMAVRRTKTKTPQQTSLF